MKLVACLLVHNELSRYLIPCVTHLATYCDEIRVLDDGSTDGSCEWLCEQPKVKLLAGGPAVFYQHEGACRNELLDWTFEGDPDWVLTIDADELVDRPELIRQQIETFGGPTVLTLEMREVWDTRNDTYGTREDGGWRAHDMPALWKVPNHRTPDWMINDRPLACGREPIPVRRQWRRGNGITGAAILHFGWANRSDRARRFNRYVEHDGGRFHASAHLQSIMDPDYQTLIEQRPWPAGFPVTDLLEAARRPYSAS